MKITDYAPRAAPFDSHLAGRGLVGAEVGVDAGAHAEALLRYCDIALLHLVDIWPNPWIRGYCQGRVASLGYRRHVKYWPMASILASAQFEPSSLDFVYVDQVHEPASVAADLAAWWPKVMRGGVLGYRNYVGRGTPLDIAVDAFIAAREGELRAHPEMGEIVLVKL